MCLICLEYQKGLLTKEEAKRNLKELINATLEDIVAKKEDVNKENFYHLLDLADDFSEKDPNSDMD